MNNCGRSELYILTAPLIPSSFTVEERRTGCCIDHYERVNDIYVQLQ